ncbi:ABC transporter permease [Bacteroidota bacterium]
MLKILLIIALRNLWKNKVFVLINILGLAITLACCIVAYYNNKFDADFNEVFTKKAEIYKINLTRELNNNQQAYGITPVTLGALLKDELAGVNVVRVSHTNLSLKREQKIFSKRIVFADNNFFEVFNFQIINGDLNTFQDKGNVLINEDIAEIYFGSEDPLGKMLTIFNDKGEGFNYQVSGVFKNLPENNSLRCEVITQFDNYIDLFEIDEFSWKGWVAATFLHITNPDRVKSVEEHLQKYIPQQNKARDDWKISNFYIESLIDVPRTGRNIYANWLYPGLHPAALIAPGVMAILILLIACFNFTNTTIAISGSRLKEISIRKVVGSYKRQLVIQFLGENILLCFLALLVAIPIAQWLLGEYSSMWPGLTLELNFSKDIGFWIFLVLLLLFTGILAGAYPAFYISKFNPINILRGTTKFGGVSTLSKILLVLQLGISITSIVSALVFVQNAYYQDTLDMGFNKDQVIAIPLNDRSIYESYKNTISKNPKIISTGGGEEHIGWGPYRRSLECEGKEMEVDIFDINEGYFETMGLTLLDGRKFEPEFEQSDAERAVIVNEKLVKDFGWDKAIGKIFRMNDTTELNVVGLMKDFYPSGFWSPVGPTAVRCGSKDRIRMLVVKANIADLTEVNEYLEEKWHEIVPNYPYEGFYQNETLAEAKDINKQITTIMIFLAVIAVAMSLIGLYTLVSLRILKRTKEFGIRKIVGAPVMKIAMLISKEFMILIGIASVFGAVLGYYLSNSLLSSIWIHHLTIGVLSLLLPVVLIFIFSAITLSGKVMQTALKNPIESLRYE